MSARSMKLGLLATVLRIAVFLSDPDPAAAAGGGIKMDLRILGGYGYLAVGNVNKGSRGYFDFYKTMAEYSGWVHDGS